MELEEAIEILKNMDDGYSFCDCETCQEDCITVQCVELKAIKKVLKYIKEESIPRAVVEEAITEWDKNIKWANADDHYYAIKILQEILEERN